MSEKIIKTEELHITDSKGNTKIVLAVKNDMATIQFNQSEGKPGMSITLDQDGLPAIKLENPNPELPSTILEVDAKGTHIRFNHPKGNSAYLFLNNAGASGIVMNAAKEDRRYQVVVSENGEVIIKNMDAE
ncbi:hypothetical protein ACP6L2_02150 [Sphingobacterium lactis]|uniref:hypothetical protein n=1 Tax=Sphingobacterium lactis TaxID=797291 RepID=UPI003F80A79D